MKICWDTLEWVRLSRRGNFFAISKTTGERIGTLVYYDACPVCGEPFFGFKAKKLNQPQVCSHKCMTGQYAVNTGKKLDAEWRSKIRDASRGHKLSDEAKQKISASRRGAKHPMWRGGITPESKSVRTSVPLKNWRQRVFERDNFTCQECGERGGILNAHHILPFAEYPSLRLDVDNGITLCVKCHRKIRGRELHYVDKYFAIIMEGGAFNGDYLHREQDVRTGAC